MKNTQYLANLIYNFNSTFERKIRKGMLDTLPGTDAEKALFASLLDRLLTPEQAKKDLCRLYAESLVASNFDGDMIVLGTMIYEQTRERVVEFVENLDADAFLAHVADHVRIFCGPEAASEFEYNSQMFWDMVQRVQKMFLGFLADSETRKTWIVEVIAAAQAA